MLSDETMNAIIDKWHAALPDFAKTGKNDLDSSKVYLRSLCRAAAEAELEDLVRFATVGAGDETGWVSVSEIEGRIAAIRLGRGPRSER